MNDLVTKEDLRQFGLTLLNEIKKTVAEHTNATSYEADNTWLKSKRARQILDNISPGTLQNLRISGKLRFKKVLGSYYYNREDLQKLFDK